MNGGHSKHHAKSDAEKEKGNGGHFLDKQKGNWGSKKDMEDTLNITRRRTRARKRGMEDTF